MMHATQTGSVMSECGLLAKALMARTHHGFASKHVVYMPSLGRDGLCCVVHQHSTSARLFATGQPEESNERQEEGFV